MFSVTSILAAMLVAAPAVAAPVPALPGGGEGAYWDAELSGPVAFRPFGEAAFQEARERGLPVLVDLGAMWCHFCRVMATESYEDSRVAALLESAFVPIRIDRDRHPDLDARFQAALLKIRGIGGWPLTAFLSGEGRMFGGGTFFRAADAPDGTPGLVSVLERVAEDYQENKRTYHNVGEETAGLLIQAELDARKAGEIEGLVEAVQAGILRLADRKHGGFGASGKFPEYAAFGLALELGQTEPELLRFARQTLDSMADGGIRDLVGGGFHRATTDRRFRIPRFEKLLSVNAGLLALYAEAGAAMDDERYGRIATETLEYVLGTLADPRGGYYAAQAADRVGERASGSFYTWSQQQLRSVLKGAERRLAEEFFGILAEPGLLEADSRANVLYMELDAETAAENAGLRPERGKKLLLEALARMRAERLRRGAPPVDDARVYASTSGLGAHAMLVAADLLGRSDAREHALRTLDRFLADAWDPETGFARGLSADTAFGPGLLEDQAYLGLALVAAFESTGEVRYREAAARCLDLTFARYTGSDSAALHDRPVSVPHELSMLVVPQYPVQDSLTPGPNAVVALAEARLGRLLGETHRVERARRLVEAFAGSARRYGPNAATLALAARRILEPVPLVLLKGAAREPRVDALAGAARRARQGRVALLRASAVEDLPEGLRSERVLEALAAAPQGVALVLEAGSVGDPVSEPQALAARLQGRGGPVELDEN